MTNNKLYSLLLCFILFIFQTTGIKGMDYQVKYVANNLNHPWCIAFLPDNEILVTERSGGLRVIRNGKLLAQSVSGLPSIYVHGQGGLFDVVVDPDFTNNQRLYLSFAVGNRSENALQIISARYHDLTLSDIKIILTVSPKKNTPHHFGGRMTLLPDGTLLITSGEGFNFREQAQSLQSMLGKVLRINRDGSTPNDNPFIGKAQSLPEIFSYGHRNPQAILVSKSGKIWLHEHGPMVKAVMNSTSLWLVKTTAGRQLLMGLITREPSFRLLLKLKEWNNPDFTGHPQLRQQE